MAYCFSGIICPDLVFFLKAHDWKCVSWEQYGYLILCHFILSSQCQEVQKLQVAKRRYLWNILYCFPCIIFWETKAIMILNLSQGIHEKELNICMMVSMDTVKAETLPLQILICEKFQKILPELGLKEVTILDEPGLFKHFIWAHRL